MKNAFYEMLRLAALVRADVSEEHIASIIGVTRFGGLEILAVPRNRSRQSASVATYY
jgi:hypothetical protein